MTGAVSRLMCDGRRLHLHHGPIDLVVEAFGPTTSVARCYEKASVRFKTILPELVDELDKLRRPFDPNQHFCSHIACLMQRAISTTGVRFITPMAAVAGAVADEMISIIATDPTITKAYVNNGGDIALHLQSAQHFTIAVGTQSDRIRITDKDAIGGVATSGWRGRSFSLGIADAVTVLATTSAQADAMATVIANAVDLPGNCKISRSPALELAPDSDLGARLVTTAVAKLTSDETDCALQRGARLAEKFIADGLIKAARLSLQAKTCIIEEPRLSKNEVAHA